ncbi:MAG: apolipoprotein N-acyltransferase, partial [Acidobacteria bacterium]
MLTRSADVLRAAVAGLLLAFSFPRFGHPALAWIALAPLLAALCAGRLRHAFLLGLLTGGIYFTGTLYWITRVMVVYGGLQGWIAVPVNAALIAYLALFPGLFALVVRRLTMVHGPAALMAAPLVWIATELGRTHLLTGFPWVLLGYSQATVIPVAQFASLLGVYGVSALVAGVSAAASVWVVADRMGDRRRALVVGMLPLLLVAVWGSVRAAKADWTKDGESVRVGLIQGNVIEEEKLNPGQAPRIFLSYVRMTRQAIGSGAQLVIWPEASFPSYFEEDLAAANVVRAIARQARVPILL